MSTGRTYVSMLRTHTRHLDILLLLRKPRRPVALHRAAPNRGVEEKQRSAQRRATTVATERPHHDE